MWIIKTKRNRHKCKLPKSWFGSSFGAGSIWLCDGCECAFLYKSGFSGDMFWWKYQDIDNLKLHNPEYMEES